MVDDRLPKLDAPPAEATKVASVEVTVSEDEEDGQVVAAMRATDPRVAHFQFFQNTFFRANKVLNAYRYIPCM